MGTHPIFESDFDCLTDIIVMVKKKSTTKTQQENTCCFCHQKGLEEHEMPLNDEEREEILDKPELRNDPRYKDRETVYKFDFEYKYGGWIPDKRLDADDEKTAHKMNITCHDNCVIRSPLIYENFDDPSDETTYVDKNHIHLTHGGHGFNRTAIIKHTV